MIEFVSCIQLHLVASCKLHSKTKESFEQQININHIRNQHQIDANIKKLFQNKAVKTDEFICIFYEYIFQKSRTKNIQIIWFICRIIFCICFLLPLFDPIGGCRRRYCNLIHWNVWFSNIFFFLSFFPGSEHLLERPACTRNAVIHARNFIPKQSIINLKTLN